MEAPPLERKLVAILAADIEGFSSHMERDEVGTLAVLSSHLIIDASIAEFGGRITSTAGDSVLAEFASVLSVINCAVQIQDLLAAENAELDDGQRLFLRVGINVGDVMMKATSLEMASISLLGWRPSRNPEAFVCLVVPAITYAIIHKSGWGRRPMS
jgi:class 3 adenylate cyclase